MFYFQQGYYELTKKNQIQINLLIFVGTQCSANLRFDLNVEESWKLTFGKTLLSLTKSKVLEEDIFLFLHDFPVLIEGHKGKTINFQLHCREKRDKDIHSRECTSFLLSNFPKMV